MLPYLHDYPALLRLDGQEAAGLDLGLLLVLVPTQRRRLEVVQLLLLLVLAAWIAIE